MPRVGDLIAALPVYRDQWVTISERQTVRSIMREVAAAHKEFAKDYDSIALYFDGSDINEICGNLYNFCKENIVYREESDDVQTTALPAGILTRGEGDCKHYASFCGGVLDALKRKGRKIKWRYRFASYNLFDRTPHHVFVVVWNEVGQEIWIDPTPNTEGRTPIWYEDIKVNTPMALHRNIAGIGDAELMPVSNFEIVAVNDNDSLDIDSALADVDLLGDISPDHYRAVAVLLNFGLIDDAGNIYPDKLVQLRNQLMGDEYEMVVSAYNDFLSQAQVGNIFSDVWRGVKAVSLAVPRNAFLGLVALNVFGYASKIKRVLDRNNEDSEKLLNLWFKLGGKKDALRQTANSGAKKKMIMVKKSTREKYAIGEGISTGAILASAAAIIAAVMPVVASLIKKDSGDYSEFSNLDAQLASGGYDPNAPVGTSIMDFIRANPLPVIAGVALLLYVAWSE